PDPPLPMVIQLTRLAACHAQPAGALTLMLPLPPSQGIVWVFGEIEKVQAAGDVSGTRASTIVLPEPYVKYFPSGEIATSKTPVPVSWSYVFSSTPSDKRQMRISPVELTYP